MRELREHELLDLWEGGWSRSAIERVLDLLATTTGEPWATVADWPIGRRDRALLDLRAALFGTPMACVADCPTCHERLDLAFSTHDLCISTAPCPEPLLVEADGYTIRCRLPSSADLLGVTTPTALLACCMIEAQRNGMPQTATDLPPAVVDVIADALARADPLADTRLALTCPACGHAWAAPFDIVGFLWSEIDTWARRTLGEVDALAREYGWSEGDILAISPWRRRWYIRMVYG